MQDHTGMVKNTVDEVAIGRKASIVPVADMVAGHLVSALVCTFTAASS
jgi:hypothetical protein